MIISASYRTDIAAFWANWFAHRRAVGWCEVVGPYDGRRRRVELAGPSVDGFVFWTRHITPLRAELDALRRDGVPFVVTYTITGYPRPVEAHTPPSDVAIRAARDLAAAFGPAVLVWRYDPILISDVTTPDDHRRRFAGLAAALSGATSEVIVSFAHLYRKSTRHLDAAAREHGFGYRDPGDDEKRELLADLRGLAADAGLALSLCAQRHLLIDGVGDAACIDPARLSRAAGRPIAAESKPHRKACGCARSVDIGAYDTCAFGCRYCYAVASHAKAAARVRGGDAEATVQGSPRPADD